MEMVTDSQLEPVYNALANQDKTRARELLTRLLKAEPHNSRLWIIMSAAVDTRKEMILCLQKAYEADPDNRTARQGLIYFGMLNPDELAGQPGGIPSRDWESSLREQLNSEITKSDVRPKRPWKRAIRWGLSAAVLLGLIVYFVFFSSLFKQVRPQWTNISPANTLKPSATYLPTKTPVGFIPTVTQPGPPPLASLLKATYTPTPIYVYTPHPYEAYQQGIRAFEKGDWQAVILNMEQYLSTNPDAPDPYYYMGEAHRAMGDAEAARADYYQSISASETYAPGWLGVGKLQVDGKFYRDAEDSFIKALKIDPNLGEAYLELASTYFQTGDLIRTKENLDEAVRLMPENALVYLLAAKSDLAAGDASGARTAAEKSNQIDSTIVEDYLYLGKASLLLHDLASAAKALDIYTRYTPSDADALVLLGQAYHGMGQDDLAIDAYTQAAEIDDQLFDAYLQAGLLYLKQGNSIQAGAMLEKANLINPKNYDAAVNRAEMMFKAGDTGNAYMVLIQVEGSLETDDQHARFLYDRARMLVTLKQIPAAIKDWKALQLLPAGIVPQAWLIEARDFLLTCNSPGCARVTLTTTPGIGTKTATSRPASVTPIKTATATPVRTATPTPGQ